jgi:adenylate cyclase
MAIPAEEFHRLEELLRRRGVDAPDAAVDREIVEKYQDHCAILVVDSSGFTRLTREAGIVAALAIIVAMHDRARPIVENHRAIVARFDVDNVFAVFPAAADALQSALELRREMEAVNAARTPALRVGVCMGIGCGRVLRLGREDAYGYEVNLASKLGEDVAGPGDILLTTAAKEELGKELSGRRLDVLRTHMGGAEVPYYQLMD